jgi:hypothetical protein
MKKFNNTLKGTDCGDAGLPVQSRDVAIAKTILRVVPKAPDNGLMVPSDSGRRRHCVYRTLNLASVRKAAKAVI